MADFLLKKMVLKPLKKFFTFLLRALESPSATEILKTIQWHLKRLDVNKVVRDWIGENL